MTEATKRGHADIVLRLLDDPQQPNRNLADCEGQTPLLIAAS